MIKTNLIKKEKVVFLTIVIIIIILIYAIIRIFSLDTKSIQEKKIPVLFSITKNGDNDPYIYLDLPDRYIYTHDMIDSIMFTYNGETKELSTWFSENPDFLEIFTSEIKKISEEIINPYDGGTKEYHDGNIGIVFCDTYDGNINIVIGEDLDHKLASCAWGKKELVSEKALNDTVVNIIDKSTYYGPDVLSTCTSEPKPFYETEDYIYTFGCRGIVVLYESGYVQSAEDAFISGDIDFNDLEKYDIAYEREKK